MEDLEIVERVGNNKSKKTKLGVYTPLDLIKTTHEPHSSNISNNFSEQRNDSPCPDKKQRVTAVMAVLVAETHTAVAKSPQQKS
jgi:hypothetical protein